MSKLTGFKGDISFKTHVHNLFYPSFILVLIRWINLSCFTIRGRVWVRIPQKWTNRSQQCPNIVNGAPLILKNYIRKKSTVETDPPVGVNVRMKQFWDKLDLRRLRGIFLSEFQGHLKQSSFPDSAFRSFYEGSPLKEVVFLGGGIDTIFFFLTDFLQVFD